MVTILWLICAALAMALAGASAMAWQVERRNVASLMLSVLGVAAAASACAEIGMMRSVTPAEYGIWLKWYHVPVFLTLIGQLLFVHYYLGAGRSWLLWTVILARSVVLAIDLLVYPNFNFAQIVSLRHVSFLGSQISVIGNATPRYGWQLFATVSLILWLAYLTDAAAQASRESRHKAIAVYLSIAAPLLATVVYTQLVVYGVMHGAVSNLPWLVGALATMAYELGRDVVLSRRARLELAELRTHFAQAERVTLMGQLASALVHELSQPLSAAAANVGAVRALLSREHPDIEELNAILDDIGTSNRRASEMISRMRQLFKRHRIEMHPLKVEDVVQNVVSLVHSEATSKNILVTLEMQPDLPPVSGDRVHLSQVLLNLVMNSIQALESRPPDVRRIVIEARADQARSKVEVVVTDSGTGIPESVAAELFKPFFTTKPDGMGMGLALSSRIIEAHGGSLWVGQNAHQQGAAFHFTLQALMKPLRVVEPRPASIPGPSPAPIARAISSD